MMKRNKNVVTWDSQTTITQPDEQSVDDLDEEYSADEQQMEKAPFFVQKKTFFESNPIFFPPTK